MMNKWDQRAKLAYAEKVGLEKAARNMLGKGVEPALVASYTNLSLEAVEALR
ncbi:MAG: hypothetical protein LBH25_03290 [Fibromonadaceae bacterium]|jgi:hypothetical protein|nr:hypothetical protein [Fibromonadaceae bacterium]